MFLSVEGHHDILILGTRSHLATTTLTVKAGHGRASLKHWVLFIGGKSVMLGEEIHSSLIS